MPNFRITIDVLDVGGGDVDDLADEIMETYGENFDAGRGDFQVRVSQVVGVNEFPREPGDDVMENE